MHALSPQELTHGPSARPEWNHRTEATDRKRRPRQDSNLRHRLRRPVLYPLSYGGGWRRGHARAGDDRTRRHHVGLRAAPDHEKAAVSCFPMPTDHDVATAALERASPPADGRRSTRRAICASAASTSSTWPQEFGTPLFVYDEDHLRQACRDAVAAWGDGRGLCDQGVPLPRHGPPGPRGGHAPRCGVGRRAARRPLRRRVRRSGWSSTATTNPTESWPLALERGVGRIVVDSFDEIARLGAPARVQAGQRRTGPRSWSGSPPGSRPTPTSSCAPARRTPSSASRSLRARRPRRLPHSSCCPASSWWGCTPTSGARCSTCRRSSRRPRCSGAFFAPLDLPELVVGGGLGVPYVNGESAPSQAEWAAATRAACARVGRRSATRISAEPGRSIVATAGMTLYTVGTVKHLPGHPHLRECRRRHERQPAARPLRQRVRGVPAPRHRRTAAAARPDGGQALRERRPCRPEAFVPEDLIVGDVVATPVTGAYGYAMASNYNKVPRPAVVFVARRQRPRGRPPGDASTT